MEEILGAQMIMAADSDLWYLIHIGNHYSSLEPCGARVIQIGDPPPGPCWQVGTLGFAQIRF